MSAIHGESSQEWGLYIRAEFHSSKLDWFLICLHGFFCQTIALFPEASVRMLVSNLPFVLFVSYL